MCILEYKWCVLCWEVCPLSECPLSEVSLYIIRLVCEAYNYSFNLMGVNEVLT